MYLWLTLSMSLMLALTHLLAKLKAVNRLLNRSWTISGAGGVAVAYVFIHILPELEEHQSALDDIHHIWWVELIEKHTYLAAMLGLSVFYGIERYVKSSKDNDHQGIRLHVYWLHITSFSIYNGLVGYLLVHRIQSNNVWNLLLYSFAMALHFLVNDRALRRHHERRYDKVGRWILGAVLVIGWALGNWLEIPEPLLALLFAFLSGAILLNVMKEELPDQGNSNVAAFFIGSMIYSALLLVSH